MPEVGEDSSDAPVLVAGLEEVVLEEDLAYVPLHRFECHEKLLRDRAANDTDARGPSGVAQGGGLWNGVKLSGPPVSLTLDSAVLGNRTTGFRA